MPFLCLSLSVTVSVYMLHIPAKPLLLSPLSISPVTVLATHVQSHKYFRQAQMSVPFHLCFFPSYSIFWNILLSPTPLPSAGWFQATFTTQFRHVLEEVLWSFPISNVLNSPTLSWVRCPHSEYTELEITIIHLIMISGLNHLCTLSTEHCAWDTVGIP